MNPNYPSSSQVIRNVADLRIGFQTLHETSRFRVVQFASPFVNGSEFWVINEKGFLWEPADSFEQAIEYLNSPEALEAQ